MTEQHQKFVDLGAQIIAIVHDSPEAAQDYFQRHRIPFPCLVDPGHRVYDQYQVESKVISLGQRPGLFIIDVEGVVRFAHIGWQQWEIPTNAEVLEVCRTIPCRARL